MLLGAELISRLYSDLNLYVLRQSGGKNKADKTLQKEYEERRQEKDTITSEIEMLVLERENKSAEIDTLTSNVSVKESKIARVGGGYADIRGKLLTQKAVLEEKIRHQRKSIQEELGEDTPLYLMQSIMNRMKDQIEDDMSIAAQKMSTPMLNDIKNRLKEEIRSGKFWREEKDRTQYSKRCSICWTLHLRNHKTMLFSISPQMRLYGCYKRLPKLTRDAHLF